jgi:hypothetical protein
LKTNSKAHLYPVPQSGGFSSFLFGSISVIVSFLILQNSSISVHSSSSENLNYISKETKITWEEFPKLENQFPEKFVEANPNIPENSPDKVKQFSFRDQQAAQPVITKLPLLHSAPMIHGKEQSQKIIQGRKEKNVNQEVIMLPVQAIKKKSEQNPPGDMKELMSSKVNIKKYSALEGSFSQKNSNDGNDNQSSTTIIPLQVSENLEQKENARPKRRPKLSPDLTHGPLMKSVMNAPRVGTIAIECRMHSYGVYVQEMLQSVEEQWNQLARGSIQYLQRDLLPGRITLRFELLSNGQISNLTRIDSEGKSLPAELCRQAIASRVPFGQWNQDMINDFGNSDTVTISFLYQ